MKTGRGWWALAGVVAGSVLLLGGYIGAYYWLVCPLPGKTGETPTFYLVDMEWWDVTDAFFGPINRIDRWLRPDVWKPPPPGP
jgi:hypothetical protein